MLRALIAASPPPNRHALSREFCRRIGWFKPDGGLKDMLARVTMLAMHKDGLIVLPPSKWPRPPRRPMVFGPGTEPRRSRRRPPSMRSARSACGPSRITRARAGGGTSSSPATTTSAIRPWSAHRCATPSTSAIAMFGFSTAARKLAPRDSFIGWTPQLREKNFPLVIDNSAVPHLALDHDPQPGLAHPLAGPLATARRLDRALQRHARAHRNLRRDPRFTGALYKASGWTHVETTQGRGRYDRHTKRDRPKKDVWLRPLRRDWRRTLNR